MKHRDAIKLLNEDIFRESYEKHDGNYYKIAFDFNVFSRAIFKTYLYRKMPWWSKDKYPDKHRIPIVNSKRNNPLRRSYKGWEISYQGKDKQGSYWLVISPPDYLEKGDTNDPQRRHREILSSLADCKKYIDEQVLDLKKPNPAKRKYVISEEQFKESYERHGGNYTMIAKDFGMPFATTLRGNLRNLLWWSLEKYPAEGSPRKYFFSEDEFKASYDRHGGNYSKIAIDFDMSTKSTLTGSLEGLSWWSIEKYPTKGNVRKYFISEDEFKESYERHGGVYKLIAKDFGMPYRASLTGSLKNFSWWSLEKYPAKGSTRKYHISEGLFKVLYRKHDGKYPRMAREIGVSGSSNLIKSVKNLPWWSIEKYPPNVVTVSGDKKRLNRGQYKNAITSYLAGEYGYKTSSDEIKEETELLISDLRDAYKEGMSVDEIAEAFSVEKAIVFRVLDLKKPNPQRLQMRRPVRIKSNPQNLINVNEIEDFIDRAIKDKRIVSPEVQNWLKTNFSDYLVKIIPSQLVSSIPHNAPEWMREEFENSSLKKGIISKALKDEFYYTLDYIIKNKPKLGKVTDVLSKVK